MVTVSVVKGLSKVFYSITRNRTLAATSFTVKCELVFDLRHSHTSLQGFLIMYHLKNTISSAKVCESFYFSSAFKKEQLLRGLLEMKRLFLGFTSMVFFKKMKYFIWKTGVHF